MEVFAQAPFHSSFDNDRVNRFESPGPVHSRKLKDRLLPIFGMLVFILTGCATKTGPARLDWSLQAERRLQARLEQLRQRYDHAAVSVSLVSADGNRHRAAVGPQPERYRLASVSKIFTALAVLDLAEEGELSLDAPIGGILPGSPLDNPFATRQPTVRDLLSHTSGIEGAGGTQWRLRTPPGLRYEYWNEGYDLLANIASHAGQTPFEEIVSRRVLEPFGLTTTSFCPPTTAALGAGSGGLCASADDLELLALELLAPPDQSELAESVRSALLQPPQPGGPDNWPMGFTAGFDQNGELLWLRQGGSAPGAGAEFVLFPQQRVGVILLTPDRYDPRFFEALWRELFRRFPLPRTDFRYAATRPIEPVICAGAYQSQNGELSLRISLDETVPAQSTLLIELPGQSPTSLFRLDNTRFAVASRDEDRSLVAAMAHAGAVEVVEFVLRGDQVAGCLYGDSYYARQK